VTDRTLAVRHKVQALDKLIADVERWHGRRHDLNTDPVRTGRRLRMDTLAKVTMALRDYRALLRKQP